MKTTRHITLFNEFFLGQEWLGVETRATNKRNINCISLNKSMKYSIENLSIDVGNTTIYNPSALNSSVATPTFPIRFYLSENPIQDNIVAGYKNQIITFNGVVNPSTIEIIQSDKLDSSNQSFYYPPFVYSNFLEIQEDLDNSVFYNYTKLKTNTLAEFNIFNTYINYYSNSIGDPFQIISNFSFNDLNSFDFESNNYSNLSISIFPRIRFVPLSSFRLSTSYTINFDLIQETL